MKKAKQIESLIMQDTIKYFDNLFDGFPYFLRDFFPTGKYQIQLSFSEGDADFFIKVLVYMWEQRAGGGASMDCVGNKAAELLKSFFEVREPNIKEIKKYFTESFYQGLSTAKNPKQAFENRWLKFKAEVGIRD